MTIRELTLFDIMSGNGKCLVCGQICSIDCYCIACKGWVCQKCHSDVAAVDEDVADTWIDNDDKEDCYLK